MTEALMVLSKVLKQLQRVYGEDGVLSCSHQQAKPPLSPTTSDSLFLPLHFEHGRTVLIQVYLGSSCRYWISMIHFITMALGGEGYLNFMAIEFGHPEWIDFPREGNGWSYERCRRQWDIVDTEHLRYKFMNAFDRAMNKLDEKFSFLASTKQIVSSTNEEDKVIVFERGDLVFVFNFHPENTYDGYKVGCDLPGKYRVALDSDAWEFGGLGRVGHEVDHFTSPEGIPGVPETNFYNRPNSFKVLSPSRTCVVYYRVDEDKESSSEDAEIPCGVQEANVWMALEDVEEETSGGRAGNGGKKDTKGPNAAVSNNIIEEAEEIEDDGAFDE